MPFVSVLKARGWDVLGTFPPVEPIYSILSKATTRSSAKFKKAVVSIVRLAASYI